PSSHASCRQGLSVPAGMPAHLADQIDTISPGQLANSSHHVIRSGIERDLGAHLPGELQPRWVEVAGYDQGGPRRPGNSHREAPDWAAAEHQDGAAGNLRLEHRVDGVAQRIHDRADLGGDPVEFDDVGSRHDDEIGERTVPIHPDDLGPPAEMAVAQAALQTVSAYDMTFRGDEIAHREQIVLRRFLAQLGDPAGKLMPNHHWRLEPVAGPAVPL